MSNNGEPTQRPTFPKKEECVDFAGRTRTFNIQLNEVPWGYILQANEDVEGDDGYRFRVFSPVDPSYALGLLRTKIAKMLSVRHLFGQEGRLSLTHDRLRGRIAADGVVVDGTFLTFDQLAELLQAHEGFQFDLKIVDSTDELE